MTQYVRIKRENKTFFFECSPQDSVESLKILLKPFFDKIELPDMRLYFGDRLLDDRSRIRDQNVQNDCLLTLKLKKQTGDWEE